MNNRPDGWLKRRMKIIQKHVAECNAFWKPKSPRVASNDAIMQAVVSECFNSGRTVFASVDNEGSLKMEFAEEPKNVNEGE